MLSCVRGDTLPIHITISSNDGEYELQEGDKLYFSVKKSTKITDPILVQKEMTVSTGPQCVLSSEETSLAYGNYKYDVELIQADGTVQTIIKPSVLTITEEVTTHEQPANRFYIGTA